MRARRSLRLRVAIAFAVFGGLVSLGLAASMYIASHDLEERLIDETLSAEIHDYIARRSDNPLALPESTATLRAYLVPNSGPAPGVPPEVRALTPGRHRVRLDGVPFRAAVHPIGARRFVVMFNESKLLRREHGFLVFLAGGVLVMALISAVVGYWLAARVIAPVTDLVRRVSDLRPEDAPGPLAEEFPWNEVRQLAEDFDDYLARLRAFIERERLFTGDVSHELRTPLTVIRGAADILLLDPQLEGASREKVLRIARATGEMTEITGALLALAREQGLPPGQAASCDVEGVLEDVVERYRELFRSKPVEVVVEKAAVPKVTADRAVLAMVLGNLLRNAFAFTDQGRILIRLDTDMVEVVDSGRGVQQEEIAEIFRPYFRGRGSAGAGLGLSLVKRFCERYGWSVEIARHAAGGTRATLRFTPAQAAGNAG